MRRSAIRAALRSVVESVSPGLPKRYGGASTLDHATALTLLDETSRTPHLTYVLELGQSEFAERQRAAAEVVTVAVLQVLYLCKAGTAAGGRWTDVDGASDLMEDIVAAILTQASGWSVAQVRQFGINALEGRDDAIVGEVEFEIHHDLGA